MNTLQRGLKNSQAMLIATLLVTGLGFVSRTFFLRELGSVALGLNSFFNSILSAVTIADVGMDTVLVYILLKPLHDQDMGQLRGLLKLIRRIYSVIGLFILLIGLGIIFFLPNLMPNDTVTQQVYLLYVMYLLNSVISYYFAEYRVLLNAKELGYIVSTYTSLVTVLMVAGQIVALVTTQSFVLFQALQILGTISMGLAGYYFAKQHIDLSVAPVPVQPDVLKTLFKNAMGGLANKIGSYFVNGSDSVMLAMFTNLTVVGMYSNYMMLINALGMVSQKALSALVPSLGRRALEETPAQRYQTFELQNTGIYALAYLVFIGLLFNADWFISLWLGADNVLGGLTTFLLAFNLFIRIVRLGPLNYIDALGLQWEQRYKPFVESLVNIVVAVLLFKFAGLKIDAVLLGTVASNVLVVLWYEPYIVFRKGIQFERSYLYHAGRLLLLVGVATVGYLVALQQGTPTLVSGIAWTLGLSGLGVGIMWLSGSIKKLRPH